VLAEVGRILRPRWLDRIVQPSLTGEKPAQLRLTWTIDEAARRALEAELFGKRILVTDHDDWPVADLVAGYRSQSDAEAGFRQLKDPKLVSFSPMWHWTDQKIRVHASYCVTALAVAHLMRRQATHAGLPLSVRELLGQLAGIQETLLLYPSTGGRPRARRILTEMTRPSSSSTTRSASTATPHPRRRLRYCTGHPTTPPLTRANTSQDHGRGEGSASGPAPERPAATLAEAAVHPPIRAVSAIHHAFRRLLPGPVA